MWLFRDAGPEAEADGGGLRTGVRGAGAGVDADACRERFDNEAAELQAKLDALCAADYREQFRAATRRGAAAAASPRQRARDRSQTPGRTPKHIDIDGGAMYSPEAEAGAELDDTYDFSRFIPRTLSSEVRRGSLAALEWAGAARDEVRQALALAEALEGQEALLTALRRAEEVLRRHDSRARVAEGAEGAGPPRPGAPDCHDLSPDVAGGKEEVSSEILAPPPLAVQPRALQPQETPVTAGAAPGLAPGGETGGLPEAVNEEEARELARIAEQLTDALEQAREDEEAAQLQLDEARRRAEEADARGAKLEEALAQARLLEAVRPTEAAQAVPAAASSWQAAQEAEVLRSLLAERDELLAAERRRAQDLEQRARRLELEWSLEASLASRGGRKVRLPFFPPLEV